MSMMKTEQAMVPSLRFPGFEGEWQASAMNKVAPLQRGFDLPTTQVISGNIPVVYSNGVLRYHNEHKANGPGVVTGRSGTIGKVSYIESNYWPHNTSLWVTNFFDNNPKFIFYLYQVLDLEKFNSGSTVPTLNRNDVHSIKVKIPKENEQQKIATFLDSVDTKIEQLGRKNTLLEDYKRGIMKQIFSQKIRFKGNQGQDFPDWEEKQLGEAFSWVNTNSLSRELLTFREGQVQNIHYGDIHTKFSANFRQSAENVPYIKGADFSDFKEEQFCQIGDVVIADASEDYADVGKAIEIIELSDVPLVAGLHTYIARPRDGVLEIGFSGYLLRSALMRRQIERIAQGISVLGISKKNLEKLVFFLPHPDEQRKIADFLTSLDTKIDLVSQQLDTAKAFKRGLLQKMFV